MQLESTDFSEYSEGATHRCSNKINRHNLGRSGSIEFTDVKGTLKIVRSREGKNPTINSNISLDTHFVNFGEHDDCDLVKYSQPTKVI